MDLWFCTMSYCDEQFFQRVQPFRRYEGGQESVTVGQTDEQMEDGHFHNPLPLIGGH